MTLSLIHIWFALMATAVMGGACLVVFLIGMFSDLGLHPDEWDVKACLDYGMTHFFPPHMLDPEVAGTYSGYGYTKLENYTWYFFLAGKVALLFKTLFYGIAYYRIPNLILFGVLEMCIRDSTFCFLPPVNSGGAVGAVLCPVGFRDEHTAADRKMCIRDR